MSSLVLTHTIDVVLILFAVIMVFDAIERIRRK